MFENKETILLGDTNSAWPEIITMLAKNTRTNPCQCARANDKVHR